MGKEPEAIEGSYREIGGAPKREPIIHWRNLLVFLTFLALLTLAHIGRHSGH